MYNKELRMIVITYFLATLTVFTISYFEIALRCSKSRYKMIYKKIKPKNTCNLDFPNCNHFPSQKTRSTWRWGGGVGGRESALEVIWVGIDQNIMFGLTRDYYSYVTLSQNHSF